MRIMLDMNVKTLHNYQVLSNSKQIGSVGMIKEKLNEIMSITVRCLVLNLFYSSF